ncbi:MAG: arginine repressor [Limnochordia bacterium]|jgi:transcriptional regulator of arginine metabolism
MKQRRQAAILSIVRNQEVGTQEELARELKRMGIPVTQATISRDIKELRLVKVPGRGGQYRYTEPSQPAEADLIQRAHRTFLDYVISIDHAGNLIVVKTTPGTAQAVAATIDDLGWPEIIGTIGGDDVVLLVIREGELGAPKGNVGAIFARLNQLTKE